MLKIIIGTMLLIGFLKNAVTGKVFMPFNTLENSVYNLGALSIAALAMWLIYSGIQRRNKD